MGVCNWTKTGERLPSRGASNFQLRGSRGTVSGATTCHDLRTLCSNAGVSICSVTTAPAFNARPFSLFAPTPVFTLAGCSSSVNLFPSALGSDISRKGSSIGRSSASRSSTWLMSSRECNGAENRSSILSRFSGTLPPDGYTSAAGPSPNAGAHSAAKPIAAQHRSIITARPFWRDPGSLRRRAAFDEPRGTHLWGHT